MNPPAATPAAASSRPHRADTVLEVRDLQTVFRTSEGIARAVDGISFEIRAGETFALVGESGCGKSVTALSIIQLVQQPAGSVAGGSILYRGRDVLRLPEVAKRRLRGSEISMIFQEPMTSLNPVFTVGEQVAEVIRRHRRAGRARARAGALEMLERVRIPEPALRMNEYPHQLSGGMKQRVMIAMALACRPGLLIADEPTTALDVTIQEQILELIRELRQTLGAAVLLITHDLAVVAENADRVGVMYAGRIVEEGSVEEVLRSPAHPYTARLLESIPTARRRDEPLGTIEGRVPPATRFPAGCRFADRCHRVMPACRRIDPALVVVQGAHRAACLLHDGRAVGSERAGPRDPAGRERPGAASIAVRESQPPTHAAREEAPKPARDETRLLSVQGLQVWFPVRRGLFRKPAEFVRAVDGVDLAIRRGATLGLVGESGCGKTTLGKAVLRLVRPTSGKVLYAGTDLAGLSRSGLRPFRRRLQVVFQDPFSSLDPRMTVEGILTEGMTAHGIGRNGRERAERARGILEKVGLDPAMIHRYPHEFSGGQRQRVAIARSLAVDPEFIVCDEATSALDVSVQAQILNLLKGLQAEMGLAYLFITHNLSVVEYLADTVAVMYLGRIVEQGPSREIFREPRHPYTRALLAACPRLDPVEGVPKIRLAGDVPSPVRPPPGCGFHPRCPQVMEPCRSRVPPEIGFEDGVRACCWLYGRRHVG